MELTLVKEGTMRNTAIVIGAILGALVFLPGGGMMTGYSMMQGYGFHVWGMTLGIVGAAILLGASVAAAAWLVWGFIRNESEAGAGESALDILKKRYARGDITKDEFEATRRDLAA
jgi:putative membrane protein